ncbi:MAG: hypothetical protein K8R59_05715 [Thermoanaerobaculales bacterium]|nr:hypothetical protein [Thermoanaerobaculales bacterium]
MSDRVFGARIHGEVEGSPVSVREQTLAIVRSVPEGRVVTYGWISGAMAGRFLSDEATSRAQRYVEHTEARK